MSLPIVAIPMGDPASIAPELVVKTLLSPEAQGYARMVVVGNCPLLASTAESLKLNANFIMLQPDQIRQADFSAGNINVINLDNIDPATLIVGRPQAAAGKASFEYIEAATEFALKKQCDAVTTPPINKEALKMAGVPYIGHTEIFGGLLGIDDPLTMFHIQNLRIFFLSRHVSVKDACDLVTKHRVLDYVVRADLCLHQIGMHKPHIAVAGLNPHNGDNGMFGDQEIKEIAPAVAAAREQGVNADGPIPGDSVFWLARQGRWDAVLSLYHDQGHIAAKTLDFERAVTITLGMPILRTSVDHGTAYDIVGTGKANEVSLIEAVRVASIYAPSFIPMKP
ncbi:4-hydroxythreonine-4-phosphate dehydrogenase PdxA [Brenneria corticis]|uniref:4-hydroxythreonine-4-phosphate dehydrogenase PdxA n=1 Tax=Brenneria corticis TaxID=2173106 RepID=A0A2U1U7M6_9GAMM|nr:4-hydroxythreonine-4-phosphate dehydrogenase PdxA [Brenneria sp. CFCC 11842]PWC17655.1 4-hydroxythreonine-4-phosphate dehydrogenase PdxA [Brenneria sp. CFCC 11842]